MIIQDASTEEEVSTADMPIFRGLSPTSPPNSARSVFLETRVSGQPLDVVSAAYRGRTVLVPGSAEIPDGVLSTVIGPNGAGKPTPVKAALGLVPLVQGHVLLLGRIPETATQTGDLCAAAAFNTSIPDVIGLTSVVLFGAPLAFALLRKVAPQWAKAGTTRRRRTTILSDSGRDPEDNTRLPLSAARCPPL